MNADKVHLLGIRHHGPGSAASLLAALEAIRPDLILLEGPPEAGAILPLANHAAMKPPVAQLIYAPDNPSEAVFYPFVEFSPEWQSICYALKHEIQLRFFDLPQSHSLALARAAAAEAVTDAEDTDSAAPSECEADEDTETFIRRRDPLDLLAEAAGFDDGERWWEHVVEQRSQGLDVFAGINNAMGSVREVVERELPVARREALREAWMRRMLRRALKDGFERIAVVCGAWHAPALDRKVKTADDNALLKGLPKIKVTATWVPWTFSRISYASGYGAGVAAPGWYQHLWETRGAGEQRARRIAVGWLAKVARLLRAEDLDVSAASVIEGVRLAETLAALRDRPLPGLDELNEAALATFCFGDDAPLRLIRERLIIADVLGAVPKDTPTVPLHQDLLDLQKRLRLKPEAVEKDLELDLRKPIGLERSELLHRLALLGISWGTLTQGSAGKGTFKEIWRLQWQPEFAVSLIEAAVWGNTVAAAAANCACDRLRHTDSLAAITDLIDALLLANLPSALDFAVQRLQTEAALASDVGGLMAALPALARILRYGNVRTTDTAILAHVVEGLSARICVGLPGACSALDDDVAGLMRGNIVNTNDALNLLQHEPQLDLWWRTLARLAEQDGLHGLIAGTCYRLLLSAERIDGDEAARRLHFALSRANAPEAAAAWIEGLLQSGGMLLLHDDRLWGLIDAWLCGLSTEEFMRLLPLLRRTFASFTGPERQRLVEKAKSSERASDAAYSKGDFDVARAETCLPLLARMLGLPLTSK